MSRRRYSSLGGIREIVMTPLIDLMTFLLLTVFMVASPMIEYTVNVSPPKMTADKPEDPDNILITLDADGKIVLDRRVCTLVELRTRLSELKASKANAAVFIRADADRPYREVIDIMRTAKAASFANLGLVTAPEDE